MKENYVEIPLLQQREIEIKVLGPVIRAFAEEFGKEKTFEVAGKALKELSRNLGKEKSLNGGGLENLKEKCISKWNEGGALEVSKKEDSGSVLSFDVIRCEYANLYRDLGFGDIGTLFSCDRDAAFLEGFDPGLELVREKTIMDGDPLCDFCYRRKG